MGIWKETLDNMLSTVNALYFQRGALTLEQLNSARALVEEYRDIATRLEVAKRHTLFSLKSPRKLQRECMEFNNLLMTAAYNFRQIERLRAV